MKRFALAAAACLAAATALLRPLLVAPAGKVTQLPRGVVELAGEMVVPANTEVRGARGGTVLRAAAHFRGRALIVCGGANVRLRGFTIDGNRAALEVRTGLPPSDQPFARFTLNNGVLADAVNGVSIIDVKFREIAGFAVLASRSQRISIVASTVEDSGSRNPAGRNNTTGGILVEEGTVGFDVLGCTLRNIRGNGIWTHSLYTSPRNRVGRIAGNRFERIGRDAVQVGHAQQVFVNANEGTEIGFPVEDVDIENRAIPVGIDTAGDVDHAYYTHNRFREINGKCVDLDGFHDGAVTDNVCANTRAPRAYPFGNYGIVMNNTNPDMQSQNIRVVRNEIRRMLFGGIFVIGKGHVVKDNRLLNLNTAQCNEQAAQFGCYHAPGEPGMLRSGIYLGRGAERPAPAAGNLIEGNEITGFKMAERCIGRAPGIAAAANTVRNNSCRDQ